MHAFRERGRSQPRVLYWFRTPPDVRVGRAAFDEDAIRAIEESNPDLTFDWTHMLKAQPPAPARDDERGGRDRRGRDAFGRGARGWRKESAPARVKPAAPARPVADTAPAPVGPLPPAPEGEAPDLGVEAWVGDVDEGLPPAATESGAEAERSPLPPGLHVEERLGPEGFVRLRARYAELLARITERVTDPARLEELRSQAERLNPDTWITDEEARAGIAGFDAAYEAVRAQLGRRRRRSRRGGARRNRARLARLAAEGGLPPAAGSAEPANPEAAEAPAEAEPDEDEPE